MKQSRRHFLTQTCPSVAFAFFGLSFLEACSSDSDTAAGPTNNDQPGGASGYEINGNTVTVDLDNANFIDLANPGGYTNILNAGVLLLRLSNTEIAAYDNCCPHRGTNNLWSYSSGSWTCGNHGNSYSNDGNNVESCNSGATSGGLKTYSTELTNNTLVITKA
ncbi:MAG: Rieske 2Fe-2S domain-containing protein [Bacteroidetes bacterium]|nr:Rieske 2Fe-2S domain-containing protein [Bacteroidota bacterium]